MLTVGPLKLHCGLKNIGLTLGNFSDPISALMVAHRMLGKSRRYSFRTYMESSVPLKDLLAGTLKRVAYALCTLTSLLPLLKVGGKLSLLECFRVLVQCQKGAGNG